MNDLAALQQTLARQRQRERRRWHWLLLLTLVLCITLVLDIASIRPRSAATRSN